ncbi:lipid IV(A) 3-deoxy-D-manno-octulosonic acid transferase [Pseudoalteromonas xiamenensis]|uniref:lipid IV(A) 3-deoxy-D-manno-octulosonic acid transferase n=1 Tax=Pseudoalteromonas xiamenensis TaxID=882626 RepID=UPI0035EA3EB4
MARFIYSFVLLLLAPVLITYLWVFRGKKQAAYRIHFNERFAYGISSLPKHALLFHCASVGEVLAAAPLIKKYKQQHPNDKIIVSTNTPTGRAQIEAIFQESVNCVYLPLDFYFTARRFINTLRPKALCVLETELWPNLFAHAKANDCPVLVLNARLSEKSMKGYQRVQPLTNVLMRAVTYLASHNEQDASRFMKLGLREDKIRATGSIKFDIQLSEPEQIKARQLKSLLSGRYVWVAGSTHPLEHEQVLAAHKLLLKQYPTALLIIAPRHPEQFEPVASLLATQQFRMTRRSNMQSLEESQVLLADTLGELKCLYGASDVAYVGGSLIERGGHNPLEAAAFSVGVLSGPHTYNFAHIYPELINASAAITVFDSESLFEQLHTLFNDNDARMQLGRNAHQVLMNNQGAINKTLALIDKSLGRNI